MKKENIITKYGEWIFRTVLLLAMMANLYLSSTFVKRTEFEKSMYENQISHLSIQNSITDISTNLKLITATVVKLDDHESRIRVVEQRQTDVIARIGALEKK